MDEASSKDDDDQKLCPICKIKNSSQSSLCNGCFYRFGSSTSSVHQIFSAKGDCNTTEEETVKSKQTENGIETTFPVAVTERSRSRLNSESSFEIIDEDESNKDKQKRTDSANTSAAEIKAASDRESSTPPGFDFERVSLQQNDDPTDGNTTQINENDRQIKESTAPSGLEHLAQNDDTRAADGNEAQVKNTRHLTAPPGLQHVVLHQKASSDGVEKKAAAGEDQTSKIIESSPNLTKSESAVSSDDAEKPQASPRTAFGGPPKHQSTPSVRPNLSNNMVEKSVETQTSDSGESMDCSVPPDGESIQNLVSTPKLDSVTSESTQEDTLLKDWVSPANDASSNTATSSALLSDTTQDDSAPLVNTEGPYDKSINKETPSVEPGIKIFGNSAPTLAPSVQQLMKGFDMKPPISYSDAAKKPPAATAQTRPQTRSTTKQNSDVQICQFVVALPPQADFKKEDEVCLRFGREGRNWDLRDVREMRFVYNIVIDDRTYHIFSLRATLPRGRIEYKYVIVRRRKEKESWEHLHHQRFRHMIENRKINTNNETYRFDGCFEPKDFGKSKGNWFTKWFTGSPTDDVMACVHFDHRIVLPHLLPHFDPVRGFTAIDFFGPPFQIVSLSPSEAVTFMCRVLFDFMHNKSANKEECIEVAAGYFANILNKAMEFDRSVQISAVLTCIRCWVALYNNSDRSIDLMTRCHSSSKDQHLCSMLWACEDEGKLAAFAASLQTQSDSTSLVNDVLQFMTKQSPICRLSILPLYLWMRRLFPNGKPVSHSGTVTDADWWRIRELNAVLSEWDYQRSRENFDALIMENMQSLHGIQRSDFARVALFFYCNVPQTVLNLGIIEKEPWLVVAWLAYKLSREHRFIRDHGDEFIDLVFILRNCGNLTLERELFEEAEMFVERFGSLINGHIQRDIHSFSPEILLVFAGLYDVLLSQLHQFVLQHSFPTESLKPLLEIFGDAVWKWCSKTFPAESVATNEWNLLVLLAQNKNFEVVGECWIHTLCKHFESRKQLFVKVGPEDLLDWYCATDQTTVHELFHETLFNFLIYLIEACGPELLSGNRMQSVSVEGKKRIGAIILHIFKKNWPENAENDDNRIVDHMIRDKNLVPILLRYYSEGDFLVDECKNQFELGMGLIGSTWEALQNGNISLGRLDELWLQLKSLVDLVSHATDMNPHEVRQTVEQLHQNVFVELKRVMDNIRTLMELLGDYQLDKKDRLKFDQLKMHGGSKALISDVAEKDGNSFSLRPLIPTELDTALYVIKANKLRNSRLFRNGWNRELQLLNQPQICANDIKPLLYDSVIKKLTWKLELIRTGQITLFSVEEIVLELPTGYLDGKFEEELGNLFESLEIGSRVESFARVTQMRRFFALKEHSFGCSILSQLFDKLGLITCQYEIEQLTETFKSLGSKKLKEMTEKLENVATKIQTIEKRHSDCLKTFLDHWEFVNWIRTDAGKTEKELHSFVDIASTNVGESDIEMAMVTDLGKAVSGFAPLIYDVQDSQNREALSLDAFLNQYLGSVWQALDQDPNLPAKLKESAKHADKLRTLYNATGSLEKFSIQQVEEINKIGIYHVGKIGQNTWQKDIDTCVELLIDRENGEQEKWSLSEVRDLRSKLMLIGGQMSDGKVSKQEIDRFTKMFDSVMRLADLYLQHCSAGNVLLSELDCHLFCNSEVKFQLTARLHNQPSGLESRCNALVTMDHQIEELCRFLKDSFDKWNEYLDSRRAEFPELNYFTSRQIVMLRQQLVNVSKNGFLDQNTTLMLMSLRPDINTRIVLEAIDKSITNLGKMDEDEEMHEAAPEELKYVVEQLLDNGVSSEAIALKAVAAVGSEDLDRALEWALTYMEDEEQSEQQIKEDPSFMEKLCQLTLRFKELGETETLAVILKRVWNQYLEMHETRFRELFGLRQLCFVLRNLTSVTSLKEVSCPTLLKPRVPNLAILPELDIPRYVLSLYSHANALEALSLENVFVCHERTTAEELRLFLRRIKSPIQRASSCRLFAVLSIDRLSSDVCQAIETAVERDLRDAPEFGLIFVCSEESSDHCHLAGVLSRYQLKVKDIILTIAKARQSVKKLLCTPLRSHEILAEKLSQYYKGFLCTSVGYGHGKSMCINSQQYTERRKIPVHSRSMDVDTMFQEIKKSGLLEECVKDERLIHIDILDHRTRGVDIFLFQLLILGGFTDSDGNVWRRIPTDSYAIEITSTAAQLNVSDGASVTPEFRFLLPLTQCHSPVETKECLEKKSQFNNGAIIHRLLDPGFLKNFSVLRCYEYLRRQDQDLTRYVYHEERRKVPPAKDVLQVLLANCGVKEPSWTEFTHFIKFLNKQLFDCEQSNYFLPAVAADLPGFKNFVVKFLIRMAKDFATRSLNISEEVVQLHKTDDMFDQLEGYELKQRWEEVPHPYLFFNADYSTVSFFGCNFRAHGHVVDLVHLRSNKVLERGIMRQDLLTALRSQVQNDRYADDFSHSFENKSQQEKLLKLCRVLGLPDPVMDVVDETTNPDPNYEITTDCALKMLAIEMRFRCGIPVIIMGETGCGKTRLIRYLCDLKKTGTDADNLTILRVHGGITADKIREVVNGALIKAATNRRDHDIKTCLFFDEANTTTAISQIKEIVCDRSMDGKPLDLSNLDIIAAVNPYRRHSEEMVRKLEGAGLGYHVQDVNTLEKFGDIPMRRLVYRVQPLPPSMIPFVWDFGRLTDDTERIYIRQLVDRFVRSANFAVSGAIKTIIVDVLANTQCFMKKKQTESAFVSLRDVERTLVVMQWFYDHRNVLYDAMNHKLEDQAPEDDEPNLLEPITRSLVLALCVCYRASLQSQRELFDKAMVAYFRAPLVVSDAAVISRELAACQDVFMENVELQDQENIAKNEALKENVFMMVMCIELRIPLFLVGKPGSSKSLAKTIVADSMIGAGSGQRNPFFSNLKQAKLISYQCSPLARADGIEGIFRQCARAQTDIDLDRNVSVAVFDEIGLAEDSPLMPLKALHGLLEEGCAISNELLDQRHKVAFVGISNWALDPAKMNRGIFVNRVLPGRAELMRTARTMCHEGSTVFNLIKPLLDPMIAAYLKLYQEQDSDYEFFGLRDLYSLVKMIFDVAQTRQRPPSYDEAMHAVRRNFSGKKGRDGAKIFETYLDKVLFEEETDPTPVIELVGENLDGLPNRKRDNRFLLILTENYAAMRSLESLALLNGDGDLPPKLTVFGSSFPQDLEYTQICRNINTIKICMDTGRPIILLNLDTLYESLYDLLNQAFQMYSGERYVDLGLGTHRLKCHVHAKFRLIVVAEAEEVRRCFPAALINRLEKHYISVRTDLSRKHRQMATDLRNWAKMYAAHCNNTASDPGDVFVGFNEETPAVLVSDICGTDETLDSIEVLKLARERLLQTAIPESVQRYLDSPKHPADAAWVYKIYFEQQPHNSLNEFLNKWGDTDKRLVQISTHASNVLSQCENSDFSRALGLREADDVHILTLQDYATEQQFVADVRRVCVRHQECSPQLLIVQCLAAEQHNKLVACARYLLEEHWVEGMYVVQLLLLQRQPLCLSEMLKRWLNESPEQINQLATHHKLTSEEEGQELARKCGVSSENNVEVVLDRDQNFAKSLDRCIARGSAPENGVQLLIVQFLATERRQPSRLAADCRAEINRKLSEATDSNVRVLLMISLPRIASFPGARWNSFHLDDLVLEATDLRDIGALNDRRISAVIGDDRLMDRRLLIKECVCRAASMIEDESGRKVERIKVLDYLFENNPQFVEVLTERLVTILQDGENNLEVDWLCKEASNSRRILERRTFRRSLLNRIESDVESVLAQMLCVLDVGNNLSVFNNPQFAQLWLHLFADQSFLTGLSYEGLMFEERNDGFRVRRDRCQLRLEHFNRFECLFPFSWLLKGHMDVFIRTSMEIADYDLEDGGAQYLNEQVLGTSWGNALSHVTMRPALKAYIHDLILSSTDCSQEVALMLMEWLGLRATKLIEEQNAFWPVAVHLAYTQILEPMRRFLDFLEIDYGLFELITDDCLDENGNELDVCVAWALVKQLDDHFERLDHRDTATMTDAVGRRLLETRHTWVTSLRTFGTLVRRLINDNESSKQLMNARQELRNNKLEIIETCWDHFELCAMFLRHTMVVVYPLKVSPIRELVKTWPDICSEEFLKKLELRMKTWNTMAFRHFYDKRKGKIECVGCKQFDADPLALLPCTHLIHERCIDGLESCPLNECRKPFPHNYTFSPETESWDKFMQCRSAITNFFVDFVSAKIFGNQRPPSIAVIEKLLDYVTGKRAGTTAQLTPFYDAMGVDTTPVIRSYLLQQLLKFNIEAVTEHMDTFLTKCDQFCMSQEQKVQFLMICIGCVQDTLHMRCAGLPEPQLCRMLCERIQQLQGSHAPEDIGSVSISGVAQAKFVLGAVAQLFGFITDNHPADPDARDCLQALGHFLTGNDVYLKYCLKCIGRLYGLDALTNYCRNYEGLNPGLNLNDAQNVVDVYLLYGNAYLNTRRSLVDAVLNSDLETMAQPTASHLLLSFVPVMQSIQMSQDRLNLLRQASDRVAVSDVQRTIVDQVLDDQNPLLERLRVAAGGDEMLARLLYHTQIVCSTTNLSALWHFFQQLCLNPVALQNSLFPTMWQDQTTEQWRQEIATNRTTTLNYCPNGHPYFIGNCGVPASAGRCPDCAAQIGARQYNVMLPGNRPAAGVQDRTKRGHCLGVANTLGPNLPVERELSALETVLIRSLMHSVMLVAAVSNPQQIQALIIADTPVADPCGFLRDHLLKDLGDLHRCWRPEVDECTYLLHVILSNSTTRTRDNTLQDSLLTTKDGRANWEKLFARQFLRPIYRDFGPILQQLQQAIADDAQHEPLWHIVNDELLSDSDELDLSTLYQYRSPQTTEKLLDLAQQQLNRTAGDRALGVVRSFCQQLHSLSAVRFLPSILRLQEFMRSHFHGLVDLTDTRTIGEFLNTLKGQLEYEHVIDWVDDFFAAWRAVRDLVLNETFALPTSPKKVESVRLNEQSVPDLTDPYANALLCLLPIANGMGLGSCALALSLIRIQNNFIEQHRAELGLPENPSQVALKQAFAGGQMLSFVVEENFVPLLMMNRSVEFTVRARTTADVFDLHALQRQLVGSLLGQLVMLKPNLPLMRTKQNILLECRTRLQNNLPQKELSDRQIGDLCAHLGSDMHRVKECLDAAELVLRFASSVHLEPDTDLAEFLTTKLGNRNTDDIFVRFTLAELNALWATLLFLNNLLAMIRHPEALFTEVSDQFSAPLGPESTQKLSDALKRGNQMLLLSHLTSFIILHTPDILSHLENDQERLNGRLLDELFVYEFEDIPQLEFPQEVQLKHLLCTWRIAADAFRQSFDM